MNEETKVKQIVELLYIYQNTNLRTLSKEDRELIQEDLLDKRKSLDAQLSELYKSGANPIDDAELINLMENTVKEIDEFIENMSYIESTISESEDEIIQEIDGLSELEENFPKENIQQETENILEENTEVLDTEFEEELKEEIESIDDIPVEQLENEEADDSNIQAEEMSEIDFETENTVENEVTSDDTELENAEFDVESDKNDSENIQDDDMEYNELESNQEDDEAEDEFQNEEKSYEEPIPEENEELMKAFFTNPDTNLFYSAKQIVEDRTDLTISEITEAGEKMARSLIRKIITSDKKE